MYRLSISHKQWPRRRGVFSLSIGRLRLVAALLVVLAAGTAVGQRDAPINIEADHAEVSQRDGESVYTGDVVLTQAELTLRGSKLTVTRDDNGDIRALLVGTPARIDRQPKEGERVRGQGQRLTYLSGEQILELTGAAVIRRGRDAVRGQTVRHDLSSGRTEAERGENERVRITIEPESAEAAGGQ